MKYAIVIDVFNTVEEPVKIVNTQDEAYEAIKDTGCTFIPCLSPEEYRTMYELGYANMIDNRENVLYLDVRKGAVHSPILLLDAA